MSKLKSKYQNAIRNLYKLKITSDKCLGSQNKIVPKHTNTALAKFIFFCIQAQPPWVETYSKTS